VTIAVSNWEFLNSPYLPYLYPTFSNIPYLTLAIERTFLGWLRLAMILVLVGMSYFFRLEIIAPPAPSVPSSVPPYPYETYEKPLGLFLIILGHFVLLWALFNYFQFQNKLASRRTVVEHGKLAFSVAALVGISLSLALILDYLEVLSKDKVEGGGEFGNKSSVDKSFIKWIFTCWGDKLNKFIFG